MPLDPLSPSKYATAYDDRIVETQKPAINNLTCVETSAESLSVFEWHLRKCRETNSMFAQRRRRIRERLYPIMRKRNNVNVVPERQQVDERSVCTNHTNIFDEFARRATIK